MRVALYARVSTQRQAQADGVAQQLDRLQAHAASQGWTVVAENIFRDDGYSGASLKRPGLERLRDRAALRHLDRVLITAPDRLARHYVHQVLLLEEITATGCQVEFLDRPMSQDPHDQLLLQIRGAVAEYERSLIAERMRRGRLRKLQAGLLLPWTRPPYGYRVDPDRPRDPAGVRCDEAEAAAVAEMFAWYGEEGRSLYGLAQKLLSDAIPPPRVKGRWNVTTLRGILTNPVYTGEVFAGRIQTAPRRLQAREEWIPVASIPTIVSQESFDRVQAKLAQNRQFARRNNTAHPYLLRALVSCGVCGLSCLGRCLPAGHRYYCCRGKLSPVNSHRDTPCPSRFIPASQVEALVWEDLRQLLTDPEAIRHALERAHGGHWLPQELRARRETLRRGQVSVAQQIERLTEVYLAGVVGLDEYRRRRGDLEQRQQALAAQEQQLAAQTERQADIARLGLSLEEFSRRIRQGLDQATWEQRRQLIEWLVTRVIVTNGEVEIRYVIPTSPAAQTGGICHLRSDYREWLQPTQTSPRLRTHRPRTSGSATRTHPACPDPQPHAPRRSRMSLSTEQMAVLATISDRPNTSKP
ncbi:Site-specific recombinase (plasmid) [Roseomonas mucosa]|nr:recombinase family protein [Roseomonas mucosa]QDD92623.1 Site-specific recombinase [Roseomonas mucosa]UZO94862.1 Site-specific recombinase [Roseomonas mucosa]